jgi:hypothetical protein
MCKYLQDWTENEQGVLLNKKGQRFENSEGFLRLKREVEKLSVVGVQVVYYRVAREDNGPAYALAKAGVKG